MENKITSVQAAEAMYRSRLSDLDPLVLEYVKFRCKASIATSDTMKTAMAHYAELVKGCPCPEILYQADDMAAEWFAEHAERVDKKAVIFAQRVHSAVDVITNSSSELFVGESDSLELMKGIISEIYPDYLNEYEELKGIDDLTASELNTYICYVCSPHMWPATKSMYPVLPGFTFDELYEPEDEGKPAWNGHVQYRLRRNERWRFVTEENLEEIKRKLDPDKRLYFLFSIDDNPNWDMQEQLENVMNRIHLG